MGLTQQRKKIPYKMLTEEQYHTKRKTWIAHIQLLTGDLHLKGKMSNVYNKKFTIFHSHPDKGKMTHLLQIHGKNKRKMSDNYFLINN